MCANVIVDPCEYGLPRCSHCDAESFEDCDAATETMDCETKDVRKTEF